MKKYAFVLFFACISVFPTMAQNTIKDIFNSAISKISSTVSGTNKLNQQTIVGTWRYYNPSMKLQSGNVLKEVVASAASIKAENELAQYYKKAGITAEKCQYSFKADSTFTNLMNGHQLNGRYLINPDSSTVEMHYLLGNFVNYYTVEGHVQMSGSQMNLLFDGDKLLKLLQLASKFSSSQSLKAVNAFAKEYDGLLIGFQLHEKE